MSKHGCYDNPKKSAYSIEYYDSKWEYDFMKELEQDDTVSKWTKNHGIRINYFDDRNQFKYYNPDFLVERTDGTIEIVEMKGAHMLKTPNTQKKKEYAEKWCETRNMKYRLISKYQ